MGDCLGPQVERNELAHVGKAIEFFSVMDVLSSGLDKAQTYKHHGQGNSSSHIECQSETTNWYQWQRGKVTALKYDAPGFACVSSKEQASLVPTRLNNQTG